MSKNNLFKLMFVALFSVMAVSFSSCEDNKAADIKAPMLLASPAVLEISDESPRGAVTLQSDCSWEVNAPEWIDVNPSSGVGNATLEISVDPEIYDVADVATLTFTLFHAEFGEWGKAESKVKVSYSANGVVPVDPDAEPIYFNDFDKEEATKTYGSGTSYPYLDQFDGWKNEKGTGIEGVTYKFSGMSVRSNSNSDSSYSDYDGSGMNNLFFGSSASFTIENIALSTNHLALSFGAEKYSTSSGSIFTPSEFKITLSCDGVNWSSPIEYDASLIEAQEGRWNEAFADFSLPEGSDKLYIKIATTVASAYRLDDFMLMPGNGGGQQITFDGGDTPTPAPSDAVVATVAEFIAAAEDDTIYQLTGTISRVVNTTYGNFDLTDETGTVYIYGLLTPDGEAQKQWAAAGLKEGDTITVYGTRTSYNGDPQMKNATYVSHSAGEGGDEPETPAEGAYASDAPFVCSTDNSDNASYTINGSTIGGSPVTGFKLGKSAATGVFTSSAVGVSGSKYLNLYAVAWSGKSATLYISVDGTQVATFDLTGNSGASGNPPFTALRFAESDHFTVQLTNLSATSVVKFSTSPNYTSEANDQTPRAVVCGVKLTDEPIEPGDEPITPTPTPDVVEATVEEFLAAAEDDTVYQLTGTITRVVNTTYGNFDLTDETGTVYIYGLLTPDGEAQKQWAAAGLKEGDTITVYGTRTSYNGDPQMKNATYVSHNMEEGGDDEPTTPEPSDAVVATVAEFLVAAEDDTVYQLTGTITRVVNTTYGNFDITDETGTVYVYGLLTPDGQAQTQWAAAGLKEGDTITIKGTRTSFNGDPQMKNAIYVSHSAGDAGDDEPTTPEPSDVVEATVAEFLVAAEDDTVYQLTGTITRVVNEVYGNFDITDETGTVYVYGLLTPDGEAQTQWAAAGLKEGDTITIKGTRTSYNGDPQMKNAIYVSHSAGDAGDGGDDEPTTPEPSGSGYTKITSIDQLTAGTYLIVCDSSSPASVFNGQDEVNGYEAATVVNGVISDNMTSCEVTIEAVGSGYSLKVAAGYMSGTSGSNKLNFGAEAAINNITFTADGNVDIESNTSVLRFNAASNQLRFRYYKSTSYSAQTPIALYKKM